MQAKPFTLVLVEDDDVDAETVERCLAQGRIANPLVRARDGIEALEMLRGTNGRSRLQPPYLFLVDIRMPRLDGIGFIHAVRADPELATTVIIVLTTSDSDRDRVAAQHAQVAGYLLKSHTDDELLPLAKMLRYHLLIMPEN